MSSMRGPKALENALNEGGGQGTYSHFTKYGGQNFINEGPRETWNFRCRVMLKEPGTFKICGPSAPLFFHN
jgi:hypothetical protein